MATPQRLPIVNSDDGVWGDIIRQYIMKEHFNDDTDNPVNGAHKTITIQPGTSAAGTAPIKFSSGTLTTAAETGALEFNTDNLYFTITTGVARKKVALYDDTAGATGDLYYRNSSGYFTRLGVGSTGQGLSVSGGTPNWVETTNVSFETVSKNLKAYPFSLNYTGSNLTSIVYTVGASSITKTLNYTSNVLTSIVLSGSGLPSGISLTKTLNYTGTDLTSVSYS